MLAPICGTNQYWFCEVKAMICSTKLFLTLSCAEYNSGDITQYLRKVNNAPQSYSIARYVLRTLFQYRDNFHTNLKISFI